MNEALTVGDVVKVILVLGGAVVAIALIFYVLHHHTAALLVVNVALGYWLAYLLDSVQKRPLSK